MDEDNLATPNTEDVLVISVSLNENSKMTKFIESFPKSKCKECNAIAEGCQIAIGTFDYDMNRDARVEKIAKKLPVSLLFRDRVLKRG